MDPRLLRARIAERLRHLGKEPVPVSREIGKGRDYLTDFLNERKLGIGSEVIGPLARELECSIDYLVDPEASVDGRQSGEDVLLRIMGSVGASTEGRVKFATGDPLNDFAVMPPGATPGSSVLRVVGGSMPGIADEGSLIFYEETHTPPTSDMLGHVVVVETEAGDVLVKRLLRGEHKGVFDLESIGAPLLQNQKLRWAAHIQSVVPPYQARRIIRTMVA